MVTILLGYREKPDCNPDAQKIALNCNKQKYITKKAREASVNLWKDTSNLFIIQLHHWQTIAIALQ